MKNPPVVLPCMLRTSDMLRRGAFSASHLARLEFGGHAPLRSQLGLRGRGLEEETFDLWLAWCLDLRSHLVRLDDDFEMPQWRPDIEVSPHPRGIQMVTLHQLPQITGMKKSFTYERIGEDTFPRPALLGKRVRRWALHEIERWKADRKRSVRAFIRANTRWQLPPEQPSERSSDRPTDRS